MLQRSTLGQTGPVLPLLLAASLGLPAVAQQEPDAGDRTITDAPVDVTPAEEPAQDPAGTSVDVRAGVRPNALLHVPVTDLFPNGVRPDLDLDTLPADAPGAAWRGMGYYNTFNCIGCHAPNGAGGMGLSLSNSTFKYGGDPENIFLSIQQGRPLGMPAWGAVLPDQIMWDLVAYVRAISKDDTGQWGRTTSLEAFDIEQVPAEYMTTVNPWQHTQPFSYGRPPFVTPPTPEKPE